MMTKFFRNSLLIGLTTLFASACSSDDDTVDRSTLTLNVIGLQPLSQFFEYEAWIVTNGEHISLGRFSDTNFPKTFTALTGQVTNASQFKVSIEEGNDPSPNISNSVIVSGNFAGNAANLSINDAIGNFSQVEGLFVLETPTDDVNGVNNGNDEAGIYFYNPENASAGLRLPSLPAGWKYNGWVTLPSSSGSQNLATGTFTSPSGRDDFAPYSSSQNPAPSFPGEDFLNSTVAPDGVVFPPDLRGKKVFISLEPDLDTDNRNPFFLQPLTGVATETSPTVTIMQVNSASFPIGSATRE